MKTLRRAVIYVRISKGSLDRQKSLADQLAEIKKFAAKQGIEILEELIYCEEGKTGRTVDARPEMQRLLADVAANKMEKFDVDLLIYWAGDRMARNSTDALNIAQTMADHGIRIYFLREQYSIDGRGENRMRFVFDSLIAESYSETLGHLARRAHRAEALKGGYCSPTPPYGYSRNGNGPLKVNPVEAERLREMFRLLLAGYSRHRIAQTLKERRVPKRGGSFRWTIDEVTGYLRHDASIGIRVFKGVTWDGKQNVHNKNKDEWMIIPYAHDPIIDLDVYIRGQKLMDARNRSLNFNPMRKHFSLLGGLEILFCGECGSGSGSNIGRKAPASKDGERRLHRYYICGRKGRHRQECSSRAVRQHVVDQVVLRKVASYVSDPGKVRDVWQRYRKDGAKALLPVRDRLEATQAEISQLESRHARLLDLVETGSKAQGGVGRRLEALEREIKALTVTRGELRQKVKEFEKGFSEDKFLRELEDFHQSFGAVAPESRKMLIKSLIRKVVIHGSDRFTIETSFLPKPIDVGAHTA